MGSNRLIGMLPRGPIIRRLAILTLSLCLLFAGFQRTLGPNSHPIPLSPALSPRGIPNFKRKVQSWNKLRELLESNTPGVDAPKRLKRVAEVIFDPTADYVRPDLLYMPDADVEQMQKVHQKFVGIIKADTLGLHLVHERGTRGIVSAATSKYLPTLLISLRMLRQSGTRFPVEVFVASKDDYDATICEDVLPTLNANCIVMSDILGAHTNYNLERYWLKTFAILFSSFEQVLWLDADCFPLHDAIELFQSTPFTEIGLVTWPDFWVSSASPYFYNITSHPEESLSERASTNGRQLLISKKTHAKTLLLASYYNYYGPTHYHRLLTQGGPGEGDKESFLAAASILNQPFYAVREPIRSIGRRGPDGKMTGYAMVQYSPTEDRRLTSGGIDRARDPNAGEAPHPFFIHVSQPKINPVDLFMLRKKRYRLESPIRGPDGKPTRAWVEEKETVDSIGGTKVERQFWAQVVWTACNIQRMGFKGWKGTRGTCQRANEYFDAVFPPEAGSKG
ncbi:alpha-1,2-mannosyltransferase [Blastomyces dermatitidis ER-3]|uniref:Alpha-1,2-mannosyltransferase n=1 Tax=Ajellomyces dermatitidis (strain ER-3 / ATCC MYA-2586) TaxID=559297 RepID=A0ABP2F0A4_AJEDR|nr:alpha-1,2-mannosyltransferase [Blastomyces dermatitidis ER-3]EEQ89790.1 alpha-1,2-mannosyltransferase [Blastomyces dermatitidis ER-3]